MPKNLRIWTATIWTFRELRVTIKDGEKCDG